MIIDLTVRLNAETPGFPGDPSIEIKQAASIDNDGYLGHSVQLGTHTGTHIDAPAHMVEGGKTLDKISPETFIGRGRYVLVKDNVFSLEQLQQADIQPGDIVLFNTEMSYKFYEPAYFTDYPVMSEEVAQFLVEKQVKMVGLDTCSADKEAPFPIHKILLGAGIPIIETLTNLEQVHDAEFRVIALPIKLDLDGAPARVVAETL